jgi:hypothetical protein
MNPARRLAIFILLNKEMNRQDSWSGETHLQKATFVLQELLGAKTGYDFILYKHGPFSFEVRDDISLMRANGLLDLVVRDPQYGPSYLPTAFADTFLERFPKTVAEHKAQIEFVAKNLGPKNVSELEKIATALFICKNLHFKTRRRRAEELVRLKPHISESDALQATKYIDLLAEQSKALVIESQA